MKLNWLKFWILTNIIQLCSIPALDAQFYFGADLSYVNEMEDCGAVYKLDDIPVDPYTLFGDKGANLIRLRLWHTPAWYDGLNEGVRYSDFADVRKSIMRAKQEGMKVLLDFHLSDTWADPTHQVVPLAWAGVVNNLPVLQDSLYNFIYSTLDKLATENLLPEFVQVGNETNKGILLSKAVNDAGWTLDWNRNSALFNSAIDAIRDIEDLYQQQIKIALHIANPADAVWYFEQFHSHGVTDFDVIGLSYYYQWHDHLFSEVGEYIEGFRNEYPDKQVMIFETAYPWTTMNADGANNILSATYPGYSPFTPANQLRWLTDLTQVVINAGGIGLIYWEPAWVSTSCETQFATGSSWDNAIFFNSDGELIQAGGIGWMQHQYDFTLAVDDLTENNISIYWADHRLFIQKNDEINNIEEIDVEVYTLDGKLIGHEKIVANWHDNIFSMEIMLPQAGCYFVWVRMNSNQMFSKIIFQY